MKHWGAGTAGAHVNVHFGADLKFLPSPPALIVHSPTHSHVQRARPGVKEHNKKQATKYVSVGCLTVSHDHFHLSSG